MADESSKYPHELTAVPGRARPEPRPEPRIAARPSPAQIPEGGEPVFRCLLLTDLVDSTRLTVDLGDRRFAGVEAAHDRMARDLLEEHGGVEIDKTDGFMFLFMRSIDAVRYALAYHPALRKLAEELGVALFSRAGIHQGEVYLRENSPRDVARGAKPIEVSGVPKSTAARIMGLAGAGQTLISRDAYVTARRAAVDDRRLDDRLRWVRHGLYRAKGLEGPMEIFEVGIEGEAPLAPPEDGGKVSSIPPSSEETRVFSGWATLGGVALILVILAVGLRSLAPKVEPGAPERLELAVLPFQAGTASAGIDIDAQTSMLTDLLTAVLGDSPQVRPTARRRIDEALTADVGAEDVRRRVETVTSATYSVGGIYYRDGAKNLATVEVFQRDSADPIATLRAEAPSVSELSTVIATKLHERLFPSSPLPVLEVEQIDDEARQAERLARASLRELNLVRARRLLEEALTREPEFRVARARLADVLQRSGYGHDARMEIKKAVRGLDPAPSVRSFEELTVWALRASIYFEPRREIELRQRLVELRPDDPQLRMTLAEALEGAGRYEEALVECDRAIRLDAYDPRPRLRQANVLSRLARYDEAKTAIAEAYRLAGLLGGDAVRAEVEQTEGLIGQDRGDLAAARDAYGRAASSYEASGLPVLAAHATKGAAGMDLLMGDLGSARLGYARALPVARAAGDYRLVVKILSDSGSASSDCAEAERYGREAVDEARKLDNERLIGAPLFALASTLSYCGKLGESKAAVIEARQVAVATRDRHTEVGAMTLLADISHQVGEREVARQTYEQLVSMSGFEVPEQYRIQALLGLCELDIDLGRLESALGRVSDAIDIARASGLLADQLFALAQRVRLRILRVEEGAAKRDLATLERMAGDNTECRSDSFILRAEIALAAGDLESALRSLALARGLIEDNSYDSLESELAVMTCRVALARQPRTAVEPCRSALGVIGSTLVGEGTRPKVWLAEALAASDDREASRALASEALDEARRLDLPLVRAHAAAVLLELPGAEAAALRSEGRAALIRYLDAAGPRVRERRDVIALLALLRGAARAQGGM